ncbi:transcription cofactor HES-6 isoform X2 [Salmo trutta]|uniref:transcription cofactor HES-6 isoform X2 n=1 Tax=Salmo trutta TaxID=8032 RepID=UPI001132540B|nr:transcription cofactor HES-6-like isoform X2 [Salmo trutta]
MTAFNMGHRGNGRERNFSAKEERKQSKLEKADVLEVTVQHMEGLQKGHGSGSPSGPSMGFESQQRYSSGYIQCMHEVHNLLKSCPGMDKTLGARLLIHLLKSLPHISSETGAGNTGGNGTNGINGTPTRAIGMSNSNSGCIGGGSPMSGSGPVSPPQSPLSLSSGGGAQSFQPCCLQIPYAKLPLQPSPPPIGSSPLHTLCSQVHSGRDGRDQQKSISSSPPCYPNLPQPGVFHPAPLSPFFPPGGDPSMWRPW